MLHMMALNSCAMASGVSSDNDDRICMKSSSNRIDVSSERLLSALALLGGTSKVSVPCLVVQTIVGQC
jgi:hypothetical protein